MKNITIKSLAAVALLASLFSCSDFLDQSSPSSLDGKNIFSTYEYAQGTIANIYQEFGEQNYRARAIWYGYNTDIEYYNSSDKADGKADLATYNAGVGNDQMNTSTGTDLWAKIYAAIERANLAIEGLREYADLTNANMKQLLGEALTLRAFQVIIYPIGRRDCLVIVTVGDKGAGSFFGYLFLIGKFGFQFGESVLT